MSGTAVPCAVPPRYSKCPAVPAPRERDSGTDPLAEIFAPADEARAGIAQLRSAPALWPVGFDRWQEILAAIEAFEIQHGAVARARGWLQTQLYGLHPTAPYARLDAMGAAWLIARTGHCVVSIDHVGMRLVTRTASRLQLLRGSADADVALPWAKVVT
jgi:hypothetical protein